MKNTIETIIVPKDGCPLEELAKRGQETKSAWIFLSKEAIKALQKTHSTIIHRNGYTFNGNGRIVKATRFNEEWMFLETVRFGKGIAEYENICKKPESVIYVEMQG